MATIDNLVNRTPPSLRKIDVPLDRRDQPQRLVYGLPSFVEWLENDLPSLQTGRLRAAETPAQQLDFALYKWISGQDIRYDRMFKDLMPFEAEVWELKTADLRIFGWMYQPRIFICVFGDYADRYKPPTQSASYADAVRKVQASREALDIDPPKFATGTFDELVCI